jgi:hypothetical protein
MADEEPKTAETDEQPAEGQVEVGAEAGEQPVDEVEPETEDAGEPEGEEEYEELTPEELEEARANEVAFSWQASEFVHHHKGPGWYATLFGGLAVLAIIAGLLGYWLEIGAFVAMGAAIMVYARKPPRTLMYELTPKGITIEGKEYLYTEFRSFGVLEEDEWHSIDLEPVKRLSPRISVLFDSDDYDDIVDHLELHLPRTDRDPDVIERLSRFLRF